MEKTKEQKYDELILGLSNMLSSAESNMKFFREPKWPNEIDDFKKVVWFRNDVFNAAYSQGYFGAINHILNHLIPSLDSLKEEG